MVPLYTKCVFTEVVRKRTGAVGGRGSTIFFSFCAKSAIMALMLRQL